jgi:hypothetical protein
MDWQTMSLAEQLGNVGSDFERAVRWKQKNKPELAEGALRRTLDQLDWTLADSRHAGPPRREIARLREEVCREVLAEEVDTISVAQLQRYFLAFATVARKHQPL